MNLKIFNAKEKQKIIDKLSSQFGIKKVDGYLIMRGADRIFLFQGDLNPKEITDLESFVPIERIGIYFAKEVGDGIRISIDGIHLLKNQINKNIFELNDSQAFDWMHGRELNIDTGLNGFIVLKHNDDFI